MNMHNGHIAFEQRQNYVRQKMDATVHEVQRRLMGEGGAAWHEVLRELLAYTDPEEALLHLRSRAESVP